MLLDLFGGAESLGVTRSLEMMILGEVYASSSSVAVAVILSMDLQAHLVWKQLRKYCVFETELRPDR